MSQGYGCWVKNNRRVDVTESSHIAFLNDHPAQFVLTQKKVEQIHKKYGEKKGTENKAREKLIKLGCRSGWVRVRHYIGKEDYWSIQFDDWGKRKKTVINFVRRAIRSKIMSRNDELSLTGFADSTYKEYSYIDGGASMFQAELQRQSNHPCAGH